MIYARNLYCGKPVNLRGVLVLLCSERVENPGRLLSRSCISTHGLHPVRTVSYICLSCACSRICGSLVTKSPLASKSSPKTLLSVLLKISSPLVKYFTQHTPGCSPRNISSLPDESYRIFWAVHCPRCHLRSSEWQHNRLGMHFRRRFPC